MALRLSGLVITKVAMAPSIDTANTSFPKPLAPE